jgi:IS5 family transposase
VQAVHDLQATPPVAQKHRSAIDARTTRHAGYALSQCARRRIEEVFGWMKTIGGLLKLRHRGSARVDWQFLFTAAVYNLVRVRNLTAAPI